VEKRRGRRVGRRLIVRFGEREFENTGFSQDVSVSGMFIISTFLPNIGARVHIQVEVARGRYVHFEGVVTRQKRVPLALQRSGKGGFGVRLLSTTELVAEVVGQGAGSEPPPPIGPTNASSPPPPLTPSPPPVARAAPAAGARFRLRFASLDHLRHLYDEQIRRGGIIVPADVARAASVDRGAAVALEIDLAFLEPSPTITLVGRVLHVFPAPDGAGGALAVSFDDPAGVTRALAPYIQ
jgi:hypothetical protein